MSSATFAFGPSVFACRICAGARNGRLLRSVTLVTLKGHGTSLNTSGLGSIVTRVQTMQVENGLRSPAILCCGVPAVEESDTVGEQLLDFLDGRTDGEELLHALYDHVLDEPVPEQMRALFRTG